jgi:hypothetical protein
MVWRVCLRSKGTAAAAVAWLPPDKEAYLYDIFAIQKDPSIGGTFFIGDRVIRVFDYELCYTGVNRDSRGQPWKGAAGLRRW